jgi:sterol desaturase/sphingolipid hydroxylase (fatty acid hydroxylase superfamily)
MDAALQSQLTFASFACSALALFFSLIAAFPGLKPVLAVIRDGVLWFCLFLVLGGVAFVVWQQVQPSRQHSRPASFAERPVSDIAAAARRP